MSSAWFEVRKPNKVLVAQGGSIQLEVDLDRILMTLNSSTTPAQWEGSYSGFVDSGTYEIFYYVKDSDTGVISPTKRSVVYKQKTGNQPPPAVQLIAPVDGNTEKTILVFDWSTVQDPEGDNLTYTLEIASDQDFTTTLVAKLEDLEASGAIIDDLTPIPDLTPLFWRVTAIDQFGAVSVSAVNSFDTDNTNGIPGVIQGLIFSNKDFGRLQGANVTTDLAGTNVAITEFNGNFILLSDEGSNITLQVTSTTSEFVDVSVPGVTVVAGKSTEVNVGVAADTGNTTVVTPTPDPDPTTPVAPSGGGGGGGSMAALFIWLMLLAGMWRTAIVNRSRLR